MKNHKLIQKVNNVPVCLYHNQPIKRICVKKTCLYPICHVCMPDHEAQHKSKNTRSLTISLEQCISNATQSIKNIVSPLEEALNKINAIKDDRTNEIILNLNKLKISIFKLIEQQFGRFQAECLQANDKKFNLLKMQLEEQQLLMQRNLVNLQRPKTCLKSFIEYMMDQDELYSKLRILQNKLTRSAYYVMKHNCVVNFNDWIVRKSKVKREQDVEVSQKFPTNHINSDESIDSNIEARLQALKLENDEILKVLSK